MKDYSSKPVGLPFPGISVQTVSELTAQIKTQLERGFSTLLVQGEISNFSAPSSGHWYFSIKDEQAQIKVTCFSNINRLLRFKPKNGLSVIVRGRLSVYPPQGNYQIVLESIEPLGIGSMRLAFEQQYQKLQAEGLFDPVRKRKLPLRPRRIGVVTSPTGAAIRDILQVLERRNPGLDIVVAPVKVQGDGAADEIAQAIRWLNQYVDNLSYPIDALIIGRGGGSAEDLWAFNDEKVARAIFGSIIPVISAVGHETDTTISDLVADVRAATPSAAAELVSAGSADLLMRVDELRSGLESSIKYHLLRLRSHLKDLTASNGIDESVNRIRQNRQRLDKIVSIFARAIQTGISSSRHILHRTQLRLVAIDPRLTLQRSKVRLGGLEQELSQTVLDVITDQRNIFSLLSGRLQALSPLAVISRGYTLVTDDNDHLITRATTLDPGSRLLIKFVDGVVDCKVTKVKLDKD